MPQDHTQPNNTPDLEAIALNGVHHSNKLDDIATNGEAHVVAQTHTTAAVKGLEPALEALVVQGVDTNKSIDESGSKVADAIKALAPEVQKMHSIVELVQSFLGTIKGDQGDKGATGEKGEQGDQGDVGPQGEQGIQGITGEKGAKGDVGAQGIAGPQGEAGVQGPQGEPGLTGLQGKAGKQGSADTADDIIRKVKGKLSYEHLTDRPNLETYRKGGGTELKVKGGNTTINQASKFTFTGATVTDLGGGEVGVAITGSGVTFYTDTVSGTIDGSNRIFTVPNAISAALALHLANSIYQPGVDFTAMGTTITMTVAPDVSLSGQPFWLLHT